MKMLENSNYNGERARPWLKKALADQNLYIAPFCMLTAQYGKNAHAQCKNYDVTVRKTDLATFSNS